MEIPEAIEILTKERQEHHSFSTDIIGKAEQLGIEVLKRFQEFRQGKCKIDTTLLPGETEE